MGAPRPARRSRGPEPMMEADPVSLLRAAEIIQRRAAAGDPAGNGVVRQERLARAARSVEQTGLHVITMFMGKGVMDAADPTSCSPRDCDGRTTRRACSAAPTS